MSSPKEVYQANLQVGEIIPDTSQWEAVKALDDLYERCEKQSWFSYFQKKPLTGIYLWGEVGTGKTYLMDLFFNTLSTQKKQRMHYHVFMKYVHEEMQQMTHKKDPLKRVAKELARNTNILCLDEFVVIDIGDAMILANLLKSLFQEGITLVTTSNVPPQDLYQEGLQRRSFLPAIALLQRYCQVLKVDNHLDYRRNLPKGKGEYYFPMSWEAMQQHFERVTINPQIGSSTIEVNHRPITVLAKADNAIWCDFQAICGVPRSQLDYIKLAQTYSILFVSGLRKLDAQETNLARAFINLVDVVYDAKMQCVFGADIALEEIYPKGRLSFEFKRTISRLVELTHKAKKEDNVESVD